MCAPFPKIQVSLFAVLDLCPSDIYADLYCLNLWVSTVHGIYEIWLELFSRKGKCGNLFFGKVREYLFSIYKALL